MNFKGSLLAGSILMAAACGAAPLAMPKRILLIPLDDRPVSTQLPQMIGQIGGVEVETPPKELLGRFDRPGNPEEIIAWLNKGNRIAKYDAAIFSLDMIAFGGLIGSRSNAVPYDLAKRRLYKLWALREGARQVPFYGFSAVMRLAPTATRETAAWRMLLARYAELKETVKRKPTPQARASLLSLEERLPTYVVEQYEAARARNLKLARELVRLTGSMVFQRIAFGQDDASSMGPHLTEVENIAAYTKDNEASDRVSFLMGIDQVASVMLARAISDKTGLHLTVRPDYADPMAKSKLAPYESAPIEASFRQQVETAGGTVTPIRGDITVALNTPGSTQPQINSMVSRLGLLESGGASVAVADINLGKTGTPDPRLVAELLRPGLFRKLKGFAGWNTAANTMGTVIPAALICEMADRSGLDPLDRGIQLRRFMLHRLISDWQYHKFTRPLAYQMIDTTLKASREELEPQQLEAVTDLVRTDLAARAQDTFQKLLSGETISSNVGTVKVDSLEDLTIRLPWPRAYEVEVDFRIGVSEVSAVARAGRR